MRTVSVSFMREEVVYEVMVEGFASASRFLHRKIVQRFCKTNNQAPLFAERGLVLFVCFV